MAKVNVYDLMGGRIDLLAKWGGIIGFYGTVAFLMFVLVMRGVNGAKKNKS